MPKGVYDRAAIGLVRPVRERFESKVDRSGGPDACHPWMGCKDPAGYGRFAHRGRSVPAQRVALELHLGRPLAPGVHAAHAPVVCHNPACCNPAHLREATPAQNNWDKSLDGTHPRGERHGTKTHPESVRRGLSHPRANTKLSPDDIRRIRALGDEGLSHRAIAKITGVCHGTVGDILRGNRWEHIQ